MWLLAVSYAFLLGFIFTDFHDSDAVFGVILVRQVRPQTDFILTGLLDGLTLVHRQSAKVSVNQIWLTSTFASIWHQRYKLTHSNINPNINKLLFKNRDNYILISSREIIQSTEMIVHFFNFSVKPFFSLSLYTATP